MANPFKAVVHAIGNIKTPFKGKGRPIVSPETKPAPLPQQPRPYVSDAREPAAPHFDEPGMPKVPVQVAPEAAPPKSVVQIGKEHGFVPVNNENTVAAETRMVQLPMPPSPAPIQMPGPQKVWIIDGHATTDATAASKQADEDQHAKALAAMKEAELAAAKAVASTPVPAPSAPPVASEPVAEPAKPVPATFGSSGTVTNLPGTITTSSSPIPGTVFTLFTPAPAAPQPKETPIMATSPVPAPKETFGQKLHTVLDDIGNDFAKFGAWAVKEQPAAHAIIQEVGGTVSLFNPVAGAAILGGDAIAARIFAPVVAAQQAAAALGPNATGAQKLVYAAPMTAQILEQFPAIAGKTPSDLVAYQTKVTQVTSLLADILNLFPGATTTVPAP